MKGISLLGFLVLLAACSQSNVFEVSMGDCFDDDQTFSEEVSDVAIVDCSEPHDNEIYAVQDITDTSYPGSDVTGEQADAFCLDEFEAFVGVDYEVSELDVGWLAPTEASWGGGDREIVCFLYRVDLEKISGTMEDSGT